MRFFTLFLCIGSAAAGNVFVCDFTQVEWPIIGRQYSCGIKKLEFVESQYDESGNLRDPDRFEVAGVHESNKSNDDVIGFEFVNQTCREVFLDRYRYRLQSVGDYFKNLQALRLHKLGFKWISKSDLGSFPMLKFLDLSENKVAVIEPDLFEFNPKLKFINLDDNRIRSFPLKALDDIDDLEQLHLRNNVCINYYAINAKEVKETELLLLEKCQNIETDLLNKILEGIKFISSQY